MCPHPAGAIARPPSPTTVPAEEGIITLARAKHGRGRPQARPGEGIAYNLPEIKISLYAFFINYLTEDREIQVITKYYLSNKL
jgi:hypothetical protein